MERINTTYKVIFGTYMKKRIITGIVAVLPFFSSTLYAKNGDLINVNIGGYTSVMYDDYDQAVVGPDDAFWNDLPYTDMAMYSTITGNTHVPLYDANEYLTARMTEWVSEGTDYLDVYSVAFFDPVTEEPYPGFSLMNNMNYVELTTGKYTIEGLSAGTYKLFIYTQGILDEENPQLNITVNGKSAPSNIAGYRNDLHEFFEGKNYIQTTVTLSSGENLTLTYSVLPGSSSTRGVLNAFQIQGIEDIYSVPEPASMSLLAIGSVIAFTYYRKRKIDTHATSV
jgi:hypothetical protein